MRSFLRCKSACELELIQSHMSQKPVLRGEVGCACVAREVSVERGGMGERVGGMGWGGVGLGAGTAAPSSAEIRGAEGAVAAMPRL